MGLHSYAGDVIVPSEVLLDGGAYFLLVAGLIAIFYVSSQVDVVYKIKELYRVAL